MNNVVDHAMAGWHNTATMLTRGQAPPEEAVSICDSWGQPVMLFSSESQQGVPIPVEGIG